VVLIVFGVLTVGTVFGGQDRVGDADCNREVNTRDAITILFYAAGFTSGVPCPAGADVDRDGEITALDALYVLQHHAGLIVLPFYVG